MGKKNPFVTTIGFNKGDPEHIRVAGLLNSMGRGKAAYIVKAVLVYETRKEMGGDSSVGFETGVDYDSLRNFVLKIIAEHETETEVVDSLQGKTHKVPLKKTKEKISEEMDFDESAIQDILLSMKEFRE